MLLRSLSVAAVSALLVSSCATYTTRSRYWNEPGSSYGWHRDGHVEWVRENDHVVQGHPGAGAAAGAVIGGLLGSALTRHGIGALIGAAGGAAVGASSSRSSEYRTYDVLVRFDDGGSEMFSFAGYPPFQPGEAVSLGPAGLTAMATASAPPPAPQAPPPDVTPPSTKPGEPPPPPPYEPSGAAPEGAAPEQQVQPSVPSGQWVYTQEYGWTWMPYGQAYTYAPTDGDADPHMYVYAPAFGWRWVVAPWIWGWGPRPYVGVYVGHRYGWYGHGWGPEWRGYRPAPYRYGFVYHGTFAGHGGYRGGGGGGHHGGWHRG